MQRLYDFIRRHPTGVDVFWAVFLLGLSGMSMVSGAYDAGREELVAVPVALGLSTVVALRRKAPEKMLLLAILVGVVQLVFNVRPGIGNFAMLVITYTVATVGERWASRLALICSMSAGALSQLRWDAEPGTSWAEKVFVTIIMTVPFVLAWVLGDSLRTRRAIQPAGGACRPPGAGTRGAVQGRGRRRAGPDRPGAARRRRANVSMMVVQADGAAYVMDAAPDQAKQALDGDPPPGVGEERLVAVLQKPPDPSAYGDGVGQQPLGELHLARAARRRHVQDPGPHPRVHQR
ncbi:hypothetical protein SBADM41S_01779 [Streptomyces badius]